jgi:ATP-dependent Clp protease, protease subunit
MKKQPVPKYFNIMTAEDATEATIFMYGYIGETWDYDNEKGWQKGGVTDIEFVKEFNALCTKYKTIHLRINSVGGEIYHGAAIINAIHNCPPDVEVHTWNDGLAASMAAGIFLSGKKRHMAKNGMLMLHSASNVCWGNAKEMRECAEVLDKWDQALITGLAESTGLDQEEIKTNFFDYSDHWFTYDDANTAGFLTEKEEQYIAEGKTPTNVLGMPYHELVRQFVATNQADPEPHETLLGRIAKAFTNTYKAITSPSPSPTNIQDMNLEEFKTALGDGTLNIEDVKAHLASLPAPEPATAAPTPTNSAELAELRKEIAELTNKVKTLSAEPGDSKSAPGMPDTDLPGNTIESDAVRLSRMNKQFDTAAASNESLNVVIQ